LVCACRHGNKTKAQTTVASESNLRGMALPLG
jgi:hypothetical protein